MADVVDDDTIAATIALWQSNPTLPGLLDRPPQSGKLKSGQGPTYAVVACARGNKFREPNSCGSFLDYRQVTITVYGTRQACKAVLAAAGDTFNSRTVLAYPSGAPFIRWWPLDSTLTEDKDTKAGQDVWQGIISAEVWSTRQGA